MNKIELWELLAHINSTINNSNSLNGVCLFIGAGVDISSGGLTFSQLKKSCLEKNGYKIGELSSNEKIDIKFDEFISNMDDNHRSDILRYLLKTSTEIDISDGYKILCLLAKEHIISSVITTNFDNLLERTQNLLNINSFRIFSPGISIPAEYYIKTKYKKSIYLKLHGDIDGKYITHLTKNEISNHDYQTEFIKLFKYIITHETLIFVGYSGYDVKLAEIFNNCLEDTNNVYWVNINSPDNDSPLIKILNKKGRINYLTINFEELMNYIAADCFKDKMLFNIDSIFIWTLIHSRLENLQNNFLKKLPYGTVNERKKNLIYRTVISDKISDFILSNNRNLCILSGNSGVGKTTIISQIYDKKLYDNMFITPICLDKLAHAKDIDIWRYITEMFGYATNNPLGVLYQFADWINNLGHRILFAFDDIDKTSNNYADIINILSKLIELSYILRNYPCIKFIVTLKTSTWNNIYTYLDNNYLKDVLYGNETKELDIKSLRVEEFTDEEIEFAIKKYKQTHNVKHIDNSVRKLIKNPSFFGMLMVSENWKERIILTYQDCFVQIQRHSLNNNQIFEQEHYLMDCVKYMYENKTYYKKVDKDMDSQALKSSLSDGILSLSDNMIMFTYDLYFEYFFAKYLFKNEIIDYYGDEYKNFVDTFLISLTDREYNGLITYLTLFSDDYDGLFYFFNNILSLNSDQCTQKKIYKFIQDTLNSCSQYKTDYVKTISILSDSSLKKFFKPILYSTCYMSDNEAYEILKILADTKRNMYEIQMFINARLSNGLLNALKVGNHLEYFTCYKEYIKCNNNLYYIFNLILITANIGVDNVTPEEYKKFSNLIKDELLVVLKNSSFSDDDFYQITNSFSKNAYAIFFNADNDIQEKYHTFRLNSEIISIIEKINNNTELTSVDINNIRDSVNNLDSPIEFFVCNVIFMKLMSQNKSYGLQCLKAFYDSFRATATPPDLDFYLSAVFMSFYLNSPYDRIEYLEHFSMALTEFEAIMFSSAANKRSSSRKKFEDIFTMEFEDGFNALTNYTYTAPSYNYVFPSKSAQNQSVYLKLFWREKDKMDEMGNTQSIIRLIHAIGQMIVLWPKEGFEALSRFTHYKQTLIRKAVIWVLTENYIKQPYETYQFLERTGDAFTNEELLIIKSATESKIQLKALEQLHWVRMFYFIIHTLDFQCLDDLLNIIIQSYNLEDVIIKIIEKLKYQYNDESIYQKE